MRFKTGILSLICAGATALLNAADAPATPDKAAAEAAAQANGAAYQTAKVRFDASMKSNKLDIAFAAARDLLASAASPGTGAWRNPAQTYDDLTKAFGEKKIFGRKQAIALYEEAIARLTGDARADLLLKYGFYLDDLALADEAEARAYVDQAFLVPDVTDAKKIALCRAAAQRNNWQELDTWAGKAMAYAGDDIKTQVSIWQWRLAANIRDQDLAALCAAYETLLTDRKYADHIHGAASPFRDYVSELSRRNQYARALEQLAAAPRDLPSDTLLAYRRLTAEIHQRSAERYYDTPDPEALKLAIGMYETIIADIPTNKPRDTIPYQAAIAELALQADEVQLARDSAQTVLRLNDAPLAIDNHRMLYVLGRLAYDAEDYAGAAAILKEAYARIRGQPGNFPRRREMIETLVRSSCAIGDYAQAAEYAADLLGAVKTHEKRRYQIYINGLKARVSPTAK